MSFLERLRSKPQQVKGQYAFFGALLVTAIVGAFWAMTLSVRFGDTQETVVTEIPVEEKEQESLSDVLNTAKDQLGAAAELLERSTGTEETEQMALPESGSTSSVSETPATTTSNEEAEPLEAQSTSSPSEETEPRVVLIATTSSEKSEQETE